MRGAADQSANIIFGAVVDDSVGDRAGHRHRDGLRRHGPRGRRRRPPRAAPSERLDALTRGDAPPRPRSSEGFELPSDVLDIPSFLRDS